MDGLYPFMGAEHFVQKIYLLAQATKAFHQIWASVYIVLSGSHGVTNAAIPMEHDQ